MITIEDAAELRSRQPHVVRLESRPAGIEGSGEVTIRDLVRNALRMRPDRIVIGEVRGGEAMDLLVALNTGHRGALSTVHANGPEDALRRIETLAMMAGLGVPHEVVREQLADAIDLVLHLERGPGGAGMPSSSREVVRRRRRARPSGRLWTPRGAGDLEQPPRPGPARGARRRGGRRRRSGSGSRAMPALLPASSRRRPGR